MNTPSKVSIRNAACAGVIVGLIAFFNGPYFKMQVFNGLLSFVVTGMAVLGIFWMREYPHRGWRRLSVVLPVISFLIGGVLTGRWVTSEFGRSRFNFNEQRAFLFAVLTPLALVLVREAYLWVQAGFASEEHSSHAKP